MQNLPLPVTAAAPIKNLPEKSESAADRSASTNSANSFQSMLSKQVQSKNTQPANDRAIEQRVKSKASANQPATAQVNKPNDTSTSADKSEKVADTDSRLKSDAKGNPIAKTEADIKPEDESVGLADKAGTTTDPSQAGITPLASVLSAPVNTVPVINATPLVNTQGADTSSQKPQSLDSLLSNALNKNKGASDAGQLLSGQDIADSSEFGKDGLALQDSKANAEQARWLDVMLPNAAKAKLGDEASQLLNNIKDSKVSDATLPVSYQLTTQSNPALQTQAVASASTINAYPGKSGWDQAISQKVVWMVSAGEQTASLTLNPPDMGPLQVVISVHNDQADTTFISDNPIVRQALEDGMANLRDKMSESGIQLGQANVSTGGQAQQDFQQAAQSRQAAQSIAGAVNTVVEQLPGASTLVRVANGLVDTFA